MGAVLWMLLFGAARAGAFGVEMATKLEALPGATPVSGDVYRLPTVPSPHDDFITYLVLAPREHGVVRVIGVTKAQPGDITGAAVTAQFDALVGALSPKYGAPERFDLLHSGSIWSRPGDWSRAVAANQRTLMAIWKRAEGWPPELNAVLLNAKAQGDDTYLTLTYEFVNAAAYEAARKQKSEAGL
jgi:hypothetical protein